MIRRGYIFETVFTHDETTDSSTGRAALVARTVHRQPSDKPIRCSDPRVPAGCRVNVRAEVVDDDAIHVSYQGLAELAVGEDVYLDRRVARELEILVCSGRSVLLDGPQGAGKTTVAQAVARALGMRFVFFNCSVCADAQDFYGTVQLACGAPGQTRTVFVASEPLQAVRDARECPRERVLIFLEELNRARAAALNGIMSAIDGTRRLYDPELQAHVAIPDNVQWIAAINNGKQFTGTYKVDVAQLDRFAVIKIGYPPEGHEAELLARRYPGLRRSVINLVVRIAGKLRADAAILSDLSMRATDEACVLLSYPCRGRTKDDVIAFLHTAFCNRLRGDRKEPGSEAQLAAAVIEREVRLCEALDLGS